MSVRINKTNGLKAEIGEDSSMFEYFLEENLPEWLKFFAETLKESLIDRLIFEWAYLGILI